MVSHLVVFFSSFSCSSPSSTTRRFFRNPQVVVHRLLLGRDPRAPLRCGPRHPARVRRRCEAHPRRGFRDPDRRPRPGRALPLRRAVRCRSLRGCRRPRPCRLPAARRSSTEGCPRPRDPRPSPRRVQPRGPVRRRALRRPRLPRRRASTISTLGRSDKSDIASGRERENELFEFRTLVQLLLKITQSSFVSVIPCDKDAFPR